MEDVILYGNGINRAGGHGDWNALLKTISKDKSVYGKSNLFQYEYIKLGEELDATNPFAEDEDIHAIKRRVVEGCKDYKWNEAYERMLKTGVRTFLTTNYDMVLNRMLVTDRYKYVGENRAERENIYSIRRVDKYVLDKKEYSIWPIHGSVAEPKSIVMGFDQYCGTVAKVDCLLKGKYTYKVGNQVYDVDDIWKRLREKQDNLGKFWPDFFFTHNVHIVGLTLGEEEIDIWHVLDKRARQMRLDKGLSVPLITNKIYYYGAPSEDVRKLLERMGIEVVYVDNDSIANAKKNGNWMPYYKAQFDALKKNLRR